MFFSEKGAELLEKHGGSIAADVYRRYHDDSPRLHIRTMVELALLHMRPERFLQVVTMLGDADAAFQAFFVFSGNRSFSRRVSARNAFWRRNRLSRYDDAYRMLLVYFIKRTGDPILINRARSTTDLFTDEERTVLRSGLRLVRAA